VRFRAREVVRGTGRVDARAVGTLVPVEWPVTCSNCGSDRSGVGEGKPCPECGSVDRTVAVSLTAELKATAMAPTLGIGYDKQRPWQEQWRSVLRRREELARCYSGDNDDSREDWRDVPRDFCKDCWHLKDHLKTDPAVPESVQGLVEERANNRKKDGPATRLVGDVANTAKHGRREGRTEAYVGEMFIEPGGKRTFRIDWTDPSGKTGNEDSLKLADDAVAEWQGFFSATGLDEHAA